MIRPPRVDVLIALALAVGAVVEMWAFEGVSVEALPVALVAVPVAWRRTAPAAAVLACAATLLAVASSPITIDKSLPIAAFVLCLFSFGVRADRATFVRVVPVVVVLIETAVLVVEFDALIADGLFTAIAFLGLPLLAARIVRSRTELTRRLAEQAEELEREREQHAARAALAERTRMAADLHDVVASGVREMVDEVRVAERCADEDADACRAAIAAVEERGRETLVEMRRVLGVLRREDDDLALAPQPSLARLDALAEHLARTGRTVRVRVEGEPQPLTPGVDVAAYRIVEEALDAAGDAPADVAVRWGDGHVDLEVRSEAGALAEASRLAGTRERVELFGGRARAGRTPRGGSAFAAHLPIRDRVVAA